MTMTKEQRERLRREIDRRKRLRIQNGGYDSIDPGTLIAKAVAAEEQGHMKIGQILRKFAASVNQALVQGYTMDQIERAWYENISKYARGL